MAAIDAQELQSRFEQMVSDYGWVILDPEKNHPEIFYNDLVQLYEDSIPWETGGPILRFLRLVENQLGITEQNRYVSTSSSPPANYPESPIPTILVERMEDLVKQGWSIKDSEYADGILKLRIRKDRSKILIEQPLDILLFVDGTDTLYVHTSETLKSFLPTDFLEAPLEVRKAAAKLLETEWIPYTYRRKNNFDTNMAEVVIEAFHIPSSGSWDYLGVPVRTFYIEHHKILGIEYTI